MPNIEAYDAEYNAAVPENWWLTDWRPKKFCYGPGPDGSGHFDRSPSTALIYNNAYCIIKYFKAQGWALKPICGMLGNMHSESNIQPGIWEGGNYGDVQKGFGIVQWTPARKYINPMAAEYGENDPWAPYYYSGWYECYYMAGRVLANDWSPTRAYTGYNPARPERDYLGTFIDFAKGVLPDADAELAPVPYFSSAFYWNYERVAMYKDDPSEQQRAYRSVAIYNALAPIFGDFPSKPEILNPQTRPGPYFSLGAFLPIWMFKHVLNMRRI